MKRRRDWEPRLLAYIAKAQGLEHAYGEHDCLLHCAAAVTAVTGKNLAAQHKGKYHDRESADAYLRGLGFATPAEIIASLLPAKAPAKAMRGDIVIDDEGIPGVCMGAAALMVGMAERSGLVAVPRSAWQAAFAV